VRIVIKFDPLKSTTPRPELAVHAIRGLRGVGQMLFDSRGAWFVDAWQSRIWDPAARVWGPELAM